MGTSANTIATANTFRMVWCFVNVNIHFTNIRASTAVRAFIFINVEPVKGQLVEQRIERTKGTNPFAEWSVKKYR